MSSISIKQRAERNFESRRGSRMATAVQSDYEAAADALTAKIARLKELRLARNAAALAAPPPEENRQKKKPKADQAEKTPQRVVAGLEEEPSSDRHTSVIPAGKHPPGDH